MNFDPGLGVVPINLRSRRSGFTLIELLVVIAIIAILAAILFPVFAQAREKARATSCLSNLKQMALGIMQYQQDYDEMIPPYRTKQTYVWSGVTYGAYAAGTPWTGTYWAGQVQPYIKSFQVQRCPDSFDNGVFTNASYANPGMQQWNPDVSINADYLYKTWDGTNCNYNITGGLGDALTPTPTIAAEIVSPARTVMLADSKERAKFVGTSINYYTSFFGGYLTSPGPGIAGIYRVTACTQYSNVNWGKGSIWDTGAYGPGIATATGSVMPRHNGGINVTFMDGHAKWYTPGGLAAGTTWTSSTAYGAFAFNDTSAYLWARQY